MINIFIIIICSCIIGMSESSEFVIRQYNFVDKSPYSLNPFPNSFSPDNFPGSRELHLTIPLSFPSFHGILLLAGIGSTFSYLWNSNFTFLHDVWMVGESSMPLLRLLSLCVSCK